MGCSLEYLIAWKGKELTVSLSSVQSILNIAIAHGDITENSANKILKTIAVMYHKDELKLVEEQLDI